MTNSFTTTPLPSLNTLIFKKNNDPSPKLLDGEGGGGGSDNGGEKSVLGE